MPANRTESLPAARRNLQKAIEIVGYDYRTAGVLLMHAVRLEMRSRGVGAPRPAG